MADDIDIEEHDVLDNPRIRNIFPDLTRVKVEVPDSDDEENYHMQTDSYDEPRFSNRSSLQYKHKNHIVLGSKRTADVINYEDNTPNSDNHFNEEHFDDDANVSYEYDDVQIKQEPEDSHYEEIERHGSCFILGSKPNRAAPESEKRDVFSSTVMLEDWGPRLLRSNCYCQDCEILFPTRNCLDAHNMATHSFLVALSDDPESVDTPKTVTANVSVNKAMKSTSKNLHFSTESKLTEPSTSKEKFCNHCNKTFPSKAALIAHLYENLTANKFPCDKCDRIFNKEPELLQHIKSNHEEDEEDDEDDDTSDESKERLFYQCDVCFCYFRRYHSRHMLKYHSKSTYSTKKVPFTGICKLCGLKYSATKYLNRHVMTTHEEYYLKSGFSKSTKSLKVLKAKITHNLMQQVGSANSLDIRNPNFRCLMCNEVFVAYRAAQRHKRTKHPEMAKRKIFTKIKRIPVPILTKKPTKNTTKDKRKLVYNGVANPPVPKSVLFQCNKCPLHFTNCTDAVFHAYRCVTETDVWDCDACGKRFRSSDKTTHERQHLVSDRFVVHLTNHNVYGRTLCQCPKCDIYYSEQEFMVHLKQGCSQPRSAPCNICDILIHVSSTDMHKKIHQMKDFNKKDLILIEFVSLEKEDSENGETLAIRNKRKISDEYNAPDSKKSKISIDNNAVTKDSIMPKEKIMYCCEKCNNYWHSSRVNIYHLTGDCLRCDRRNSRVCKKCGLYFTSKYHDAMMHKSGGTIFDYIFIRVHDNKIINPMPSYPKCFKCKMHYVNKKGRHFCNNTNSYKICEYCEKPFSETAYKLHVAFHEYAFSKGSKTALNNKPKGNKAKKELGIPKPGIVSVSKSTSGKSPPMPELLKKYNLITNTWNILYLCEVCDIVCDSYDKMVEHSQDHFNNMESYDMTIVNCEICDLRFDGTCYDKHKDIHDENVTLNRQYFNILKYNYVNLFSDDWFELFETLPRTQVEQIVSQSIYVRDRNIRMRITQHGPAENTVYKCGRCNGYLTVSMVQDHFERTSCWPPNYKCKLCYLDFSMNGCLKEHQIVCRTTHQSYREVIFNDVIDDSFNRGLQMMVRPEQSSTDNVDTKKNAALIKIYKCEICQCCLSGNKKIKSHTCMNISEGMKCNQCDLYFKSKYFYRHKALHIKFPNLSKSNIMTIPFKQNKYEGLPKLYRCQCGLHFTSLQTADKHLTLCKPGYKISKENCSKCGLLFPTSVLVSHLCSHHSNDKRTEFNIHHMEPKPRSYISTKGVVKKPIPKVTVHKCAQCNICFFTKRTLSDHFARNHKINMDIRRCNQCGINLTRYSLTRHTQLHHKVRQITRADLKIKVYRKIANIITEDPTRLDDNVKPKPHATERQEKSVGNYALNEHIDYSKYLYKCPSCDIHFLSITACNTHYARYHVKIRKAKQKTTNCHVCGLAFALPSLFRHTAIHHEKMNLKREDFFIIESALRCGNVLYKCEQCDVCFVTHTGFLRHWSIGIHLTPGVACDICGYRFPLNRLQGHVSTHHKIQKLSRDDFNIITRPLQYSKTKAVKINTKALKIKTKAVKILKQDEETPNYKSNVTNRLYKCRTCSVHFCKEKDLISHVSETALSCNNNTTANCKYCHLEFTPDNIDRHINGQHKTLKLDKEFVIIENDIIDGAYASRYLYKCTECNTNFVTEATAELHVHAAGKSKCRSCGLQFSLAELGDHKNNHHNLMNLSLDDFHFVDICKTAKVALSHVKTNRNGAKTVYNLTKKGKAALDRTVSKYDNTIYSCKCGLHYLALRTFTKHLYECNRRKNSSDIKVPCKNCGYTFSAFSLAVHQYIQHEKMKLKLKDFRILTEKDLKHEAADESESSESPSKIVHLPRSSFNFSDTYLSSLDMDQFSNQLYRCQICHKHYITFSTATKHGHDAAGEECTICGLLFTNRIMLKHKYIHHERLGLNRDDFLIQNDFIDKQNIYNYSLYKCDVCDKHFVKFTSAHAHTDERCAMATCEENCDHCGLRFYADELKLHKTVHHRRRDLKREDFYIIHYSGATRKTKDNIRTDEMSSIDNSTDLDQSDMLSEKADESEIGNDNEPETSSLKMDVSVDDLHLNVSKPNTTESSAISSTKNVIKLYKCGDCNVFYITQSTCYKHVLNHEPLDSMEYIECKLCGLQFRILTLHKHMLKHHKSDFNLKNVLIEEYRSTKEKTPKIDIYYALDKVQSRLVSTTTDSKEVSEEKVDSTVQDAVGPVDNQENTEKDAVSTVVEQTATTSTAENITSPDAEDKEKENNSNHVKDESLSENVDKLVPDPSTVENELILPCNVNNSPNCDDPLIDQIVTTSAVKNDKDTAVQKSDPSIDQIVTTSAVKNDNDTAVQESATESNVKDVTDRVVDQLMTNSTVESNCNASAKETTSSDL